MWMHYYANYYVLLRRVNFILLLFFISFTFHFSLMWNVFLLWRLDSNFFWHFQWYYRCSFLSCKSTRCVSTEKVRHVLHVFEIYFLRITLSRGRFVALNWLIGSNWKCRFEFSLASRWSIMWNYGVRDNGLVNRENISWRVALFCRAQRVFAKFNVFFLPHIERLLLSIARLLYFLAFPLFLTLLFIHSFQ